MPSEHLRPIHQRVHAHVRAAKLTHAQLAEKLTQAQPADRRPWNEQRVYRVLAGATRLEAEDMELIAIVLDKPVADLYVDIEDVEAKAS